MNICQQCGDSGFHEALIPCDKCNTVCVHLYCLPALPASLEDDVIWYCEDCESKKNFKHTARSCLNKRHRTVQLSEAVHKLSEVGKEKVPTMERKRRKKTTAGREYIPRSQAFDDDDDDGEVLSTVRIEAREEPTVDVYDGGVLPSARTEACEEPTVDVTDCGVLPTDRTEACEEPTIDVTDSGVLPTDRTEAHEELTFDVNNVCDDPYAASTDGSGKPKVVSEPSRRGLKRKSAGLATPKGSDRGTRTSNSRSSAANIPPAKFPNVRCNLGKFRALVKTLNKCQRQWVEEMGFESLLEMSLHRVDQHLCYWLMQRFNPATKELLIREDYGVRIDASDVGWVLGLPMGPYLVPVDDARYGKVEALKIEYQNQCGISEEFLRRRVREGQSRKQFQVDFLLYVLGVVLCPTQSNKISPLHLKAACLGDDINLHNWCEYVLDWLVKYSVKFQNSMAKTGHVGGLGGCAIFLMIFYLDRLNVGHPVNWDVTDHRAKAWKKEDAFATIEADRADLWSFGQCNVVRDVVYGKPYPIGVHKVCWEAVRLNKMKHYSNSVTYEVMEDSSSDSVENTS